VRKTPFDLWIYQEMLHELMPDLIIETGTAEGGSALYLASICDLIGSGRIVTIDIEEGAARPAHDRIRYVLGSSTDPKIVKLIADETSTASSVLVILDSDHSACHVSAEIEAYAPFVTPGSYLIVEDTNINGHPVYKSFGPGPMEAVKAFLDRSDDFSIDRSRQKFGLTFNPNGYLKRTTGSATARVP
jgi:cephalosporin hydroxylase